MDKGAKTEDMHPEGVNALMYAAAGGHESVVDYLIMKVGLMFHFGLQSRSWCRIDLAP